MRPKFNVRQRVRSLEGIPITGYIERRIGKYAPVIIYRVRFDAPVNFGITYVYFAEYEEYQIEAIPP